MKPEFSFLNQKNGESTSLQQADPGAPTVGPMALETARMALAKYDPDIDALVEKLDAVEITTGADLGTVAEMVGQAKALIKSLNLAAEVSYKPAYDFYKSIRNLLTMYTNRLQAEIIQPGNKKASDYGYQKEMERRKAEAEQQKKIAEQQKKLNALAKKNKVPAVQIPKAVVPEKAAPVKTESGSVNIKMVWKATVVDIKSPAVADYIRATCFSDYEKLADKALAKAVKSGIRKMAGVTFAEVAEAKHRAR
jgi:uncharacterized coiled-coil protein SlyX